jgi:hypothetical protein
MLDNPAQAALEKYGLRIKLSKNSWVGSNWYVQGAKTWAAGIFTCDESESVDWDAWAARIARDVGAPLTHNAG